MRRKLAGTLWRLRHAPNWLLQTTLATRHAPGVSRHARSHIHYNNAGNTNFVNFRFPSPCRLSPFDFRRFLSDFRRRSISVDTSLISVDSPFGFFADFRWHLIFLDVPLLFHGIRFSSIFRWLSILVGIRFLLIFRRCSSTFGFRRFVIVFRRRSIFVDVRSSLILRRFSSTFDVRGFFLLCSSTFDFQPIFRRPFGFCWLFLYFRTHSILADFSSISRKLSLFTTCSSISVDVRFS